jgi:hypothetical protein
MKTGAEQGAGDLRRTAPARTVWRKRPYLAAATGVLLGGLAFGAAAGALGPGLPAGAAAALPAVVGFVLGAWLYFRGCELAVDRRAGLVTERVLGRWREICPLAALKQADVEEAGAGRGIVLLAIEGVDREQEAGGGPWPIGTARAIAECLNDCIGLPEERRGRLRYRREAQA